MKVTVDSYIKRFDQAEQKQMQALRKLIQKHAPSSEGISYNMPSFTWQGNEVAGFLMYKNHLGFYPFSGNILKQFKKELAGFKQSPGALQLPKDKALPENIIERLLIARKNEILKNNKYYYLCPKPLKYLEIMLDEQGKILKCIFVDKKEYSKLGLPAEISAALDNYFNNKKPLPYKLVSKNLVGTPFQKSVWKIIEKVPMGKTISYTQIAQALGSPQAARAAGTACGKNPIALFVPCQRVVRKTGQDLGYAWGSSRKQWLLNFEK